MSERLPVPFYAPPDRPLWTHDEVDAYYAERLAEGRPIVPLVGATLIRCGGRPDVSITTIFRMVSAAVFWNDPPVLWETFVIGTPADFTTTRYRSPEDATDGHRTVVLETQRALTKRGIPVIDIHLSRGEWWVE